MSLHIGYIAESPSFAPVDDRGIFVYITSMPPRQIYLLSPKELSPETIAVAFAKTSRSPESFREIAAELTDKASAKFHEKWVVGYGHASVAEHAVLHIAIENVSHLAFFEGESKVSRKNALPDQR